MAMNSNKNRQLNNCNGQKKKKLQLVVQQIIT